MQDQLNLQEKYNINATDIRYSSYIVMRQNEIYFSYVEVVEELWEEIVGVPPRV